MIFRNVNNNNRNRIDNIMWYCFYFDLFWFFVIVSLQRRREWILGKRRTLILTTAAITDISLEKLLYHMVYFGMTGGSPSFILLKVSAGVFCSFLLFFYHFFPQCAVCWLGFWKLRTWRIPLFSVLKQWTFLFFNFFFFLGPENVDWGKY